MAWLKDKNGALYRTDAVVAVTPLPQKEDKRDQTKVTRTLALVHLAGGAFHTELDFDEVVAKVAPAVKTPPPSDPAA